MVNNGTQNVFYSFTVEALLPLCPAQYGRHGCFLPRMVADGIFVGKFIGSHALAAINLVMPVIMISFALSDMIAVGSSVQISIRLGQGKEREACTVFSFSSLFIVAISCLVGLAGFFGGAQAVRLMGAGDDVLNLAVEYMRVYAVFAPFIMIFFALDNYLRVCGRTIYSMGMNIFIALSNLFFDWLFIVHFRMGVSSAALASCISLTLGTGIGLFPFFGKKLVLRFVSPRIPWHILRNIIGNGSSEFFSNISASVSMVIMNAVLLRLSGAMAVAAFSIVMYIDSFVSSMLFGMVDALQPAISYNFGAAKYTRMFRLEKDTDDRGSRHLHLGNGFHADRRTSDHSFFYGRRSTGTDGHGLTRHASFLLLLSV